MDTLEISEKNHSETEPALGGSRRTRTCTRSRLQVLLCVIVAILLIAVMGILMAMFGPGNKDLKYRDCHNYEGQKDKETTTRSRDVQCDVAIIGGGISGLYVAETLLRMKKETSVCVFEKEKRFGGRILDHWFHHAPNIAVGLGAWRVDKNNANMLNLIRRLNISTLNWSFHKPTLHKIRGVFANNSKRIKQQAFPTLNKGKFMNMTRKDMVSYAFSDDCVSTAPLFTTFGSYISYYLTPEGTEFLSETSGYKGVYKELNDAATYIEYLKSLYSSFTGLFRRPLDGMSEVINSLVASVTKYGGTLYAGSAVLSINKTKTSFVLKTTNLTISAEKVVIATHPTAFMKVKGGVAHEIHQQPMFQSIQTLPAFKGAAVYREAWWQNKTAGHRILEPRQLFVSLSNCLGFTMPYGGRGPNGEAVLHTMYMDGACSRRWGDMLKISKSLVDKEVKRALEYKFGMSVPDPLDTVYQYWEEGAWHHQKPGFNFTLTEVSDWAKRPFPDQHIFIVGDAYSLYRGWTEGAIISAKNALLEGWQVKEKSSSRRKKSTKVPLSELVLDPSKNLQIL